MTAGKPEATLPQLMEDIFNHWQAELTAVAVELGTMREATGRVREAVEHVVHELSITRTRISALSDGRVG